jgi:hypothetical protein
MIRFWFYLLIAVTALPNAWGQTDFSRYFTPQTLRIDCILAGTADTKHLFLSEMRLQPVWGGAQKTLVDDLDFGQFRVMVLDDQFKDTLYLRGFSSLFEEWQTTDEAKKVAKSFPLVITVPFPKQNVGIVVEGRNRDGHWDVMLKHTIDVASLDIRRDLPAKPAFSCVVNGGKSEDCVDLVFLSEGYAADQMDKFNKDVQRMADYLFTVEPYAKLKGKFNIWAVAMPSAHEGPDDPRANIWRQTVFNSSFNTFGTDRYLETFDMFGIHDALAFVPCDHAIVLVNTNKYGGGGVYNSCSVGSADHKLSKIVFVHELGHGLGGLGDEYYDSEVAYDDYINLKAEPWEPNLTTLVNFDRKWKFMVDASTPVPTPNQSAYKKVVGVFEGGGYTAKGVYRPAYDCRMKSNEPKAFCPVCQYNIEKVIKSLTE